MKRPWAALILVLALSVMPRMAAAQDSKSSKGGVTLRQNYPNPFNPETDFSFSIDCTVPGKQYRVTLTIWNVIAQMVAIPVLKGGTGGVSGGTPLNNVSLPCGDYVAHWD